MLTIEECRKLLKLEDISEIRVKIIRDYLYALCKELIKTNIDNYEKDVRETNESK